MPIDLNQLNTDMGEMIADLPTLFTFSGVVYSGVFTDVEQGNKLDEGGYISELAGQIYAQQSDFSVLPVSGVTVGVDSKTYRVEKVSLSPDGVGIRMDLITPDK